jgi:hypothetical protein
LTFKEINEKWLESRRNKADKNISIEKRTFHNHINAIQKEYGIHIECGSGYRYFIADSFKDVQPKVERLSILNMLSETISDSKLSNNLFIEDYFDILQKNKVMMIMDAIKTRHKIRLADFFNMKNPNDIYRVLNVAPYQLHYICSNWYVIGHTDEFGLMRIPLKYYHASFQLLDDSYKYPDNYSTESCRKMIYGKSENIIHVTIRITSRVHEKDYFIRFPLMPFQKKVEYNLWPEETPLRKYYSGNYAVINLELPKSAFALYTLKNKLMKYSSYKIMNDVDPFTLFTEEEYNEAMSNPTIL